MRKLLALLAFVSVSAFAQTMPPAPMPVFPHVYNNYSYATVEAWNNNRMGVVCSGYVFMTLEDNKMDSEYVNMYVPAMGYRSQNVYPRAGSSKIKSTNNSIWCN